MSNFIYSDSKNYSSLVTTKFTSQKFPSEWYMILVSACGSFSGFLHGYVVTLTWLFPQNPSLLNSISSSVEQRYFTLHFVPFFFVGEILGSLFGYLVADAIGRKSTLIYFSALTSALLSWSSTSTSLGNMLLSRLLVGIAIGVLICTSPIYISESSTKELRGRAIAIYALAIILGNNVAGILYMLTLTSGQSWRISVGFPILISLLMLVGLYFLPESPRWLLARRTPAECLSALRRLRGVQDVSFEFNEVYRALSIDARYEDSWIALLSLSSIRYRILLSLLLQIGQRVVGIQLLTIYTGKLLHMVGVKSVMIGVTCVAISSVTGALSALYLIETLGRRKSLLIGCFVMVIVWLSAALCISVGQLTHPRTTETFLSIILVVLFGILLCIFSCAYSISIGPVSWILPAEIFPLWSRSKAFSLSCACHGVTSLLVYLCFNHWIDAVTQFEPCKGLLIFSAVAALLGIFFYFTIPETKGVMLEDMDALFTLDSSGSNSNNNRDVLLGCCPSYSNDCIGFRNLSTVSEERVRQQTLRSSQQNQVGGGAPSRIIFIPNTLHKYSAGLRESAFEYDNLNEEELLVTSTRIVADKRYYSSLTSS